MMNKIYSYRVILFMKKIFSVYLALFLCAGIQIVLWAEPIDFATQKSTHFIIKYRCEKQFARKVGQYAEQYYYKIENDLCLNRFSNFWTWDKRCIIIIYSSYDEYIRVTGQPDWSGGHVDYKNRVIYSFQWADNFLSVLLPHELTHIIFREYAGSGRRIPLWIDEGLAQYEERTPNPERAEVLKKSVRGAMFIPLNNLQKINELTTQPTDGVVLFYAQSESIISFMIQKFGKTRFAEFIRQLRSGKTVPESLRLAYAGTIDTLDKLEIKWLESVQ